MIRLITQYSMDNSWLPLRPDMVATALAYGMEVKIMGRCKCGHHEEDHDDDGILVPPYACLVDECACEEFQPEDEEDYDDADDAND
jgi:hypothetical protein